MFSLTGTSRIRALIASIALAIAVVPAAAGAARAQEGTITHVGSADSTAVRNIPGDGFARTLGGAASLFMPRATDFTAVDPVGGYATVTGTVRGPGGTALPSGGSGSVELIDSAGKPVELYNSSGGTGSTFDASGTYGFTGLAAGDYRLDFDYWDWAEGKRYFGTAPAHVSAGATSANINPQLVAGGRITGTVRGPGGAALPAGTNGQVMAFKGDRRAQTASFASDGVYTLGNLASGDYQLHFDIFSGGLADEWWQNATSSDAATPVHVTVGSTTTNINPELAAAGAIAGKVRGPGGAALPAGTNGDVDIYDASGVVVRTVYFYEDGVYTADGLATGDYKLRFNANTGPAGVTWWQNAATQGSATAVHVTAGATTANINPQLVAGGGITGTVRGPGGAALPAGTGGDVDIYDASGEVVRTVAFDEDGVYTADGLATGDYKLRFDPYVGNLLGTWWQNAATQGSATAVHVTAGATTANINPQLVAGGGITGTVRGPGGAALPVGYQGWVDVFDSTGAQIRVPWPYGRFGDDGVFTVAGLATGDYRLRFGGLAPNIANAWWWQNGTSLASATPVHVNVGATTANISPQLAAAGKITGTVRGPGGSALSAGSSGAVVVFDSHGESVGLRGFGADGAFTVGGLAAGAYKVRIFSNDYRYRTQWFGGAMSAADANTVTVTGGGSTTVAPSLALTGTPTAPDKPTAVKGVPGAGSVALSWTPPAANGGSSVSDYVVQYSINGGGTWMTFNDGVSATNSAKVTGLTNLTRYIFRVAAKNSAGTSSPSTPSAPVMPRAVVPSAPRSPRVLASPAPGKARITWVAPLSNGGTPVLRYLVRVSAANSTTRYGAWVVNVPTSRILTGLKKAATYRVQIMAVNSQGNSAPALLAFRQAR